MRTLMFGTLIVLFFINQSAFAQQATQSLLLGRGVNIELWRSSDKVGTSDERIDRAKAAGFTFVRIGISVTPWLQNEIVKLGYPVPGYMQGNDALKTKTLSDLSEAIVRARTDGLKSLVALFITGTPAGLTGGRMLCDIPDGQQSYQKIFNEVLSHIPDTPGIAIEPFNEPPGGCTPTHYATATGGMWPQLQLKLYQTVRKEKPHLTFIVTAGSYEQLDGLLAFDPTPYLADKNTIMAIHYYEPLIFTSQYQTSLHKAEGFTRHIPWPNEGASLAEGRKETFAALKQVQSGKELIESEESLNADFERYPETGTKAYLINRFQKLADWASHYRLSPERIVIGEFGVHRPTDGTSGEPLDGAGRYLTAVKTAIETHRFSWAIWDLDGGMAFLCGTPPHEEVCPAYRSVMMTPP